MSYWRACERVVLGSILALSFSATLRAQEQQPPTENAQLQTPGYNAVASSSTTVPASPTADSWQFVSLSYLWFPGLHGTIGARGYETSPHVSPSDLASHFNIGIMGSFEAQHNRWGLPFDYVWVKVGDNKTLTNFPGYTANPTAKEGILTPKVTYLAVDGERIKVKATVGLSFMMLGDAGGGGANVDYQVAGLLNYQIKPKWGIGLGYRYVDVNYRNSNGFIFDTAQSGIAFTLLYKYGKQPAAQ
jgi:hypothetical protein